MGLLNVGKSSHWKVVGMRLDVQGRPPSHAAVGGALHPPTAG